MVGKIFITRSGYDPEHGAHVKDPYLEGEPSLGACRPDLRRALKPGDHIFTISGKLSIEPTISQYIMCCFEVLEKIDAVEAYERFPHLRLHTDEKGNLTGNVIVDKDGNQHPLDHHEGGESFNRRIKNFIVGKNLVKPETPTEIAAAREQTMDVLRRVLGKIGNTPHDLIGRSAKNLDEKQVTMMREWLLSLKEEEKIVRHLSKAI